MFRVERLVAFASESVAYPWSECVSVFIGIRTQTDTERLMACFALGNSLFWPGELLEAKYWQQQGIALAAKLPPGE